MTGLRRVLIYDDDEAFDRELGEVLCEAGYEVFRACDRIVAQRILAEKRVLVVLLGTSRPAEEVLGELGWIKDHSHSAETVIFSGRGHFRTAFDAMSRGAFDFLVKSPNLVEFLPVVDRAFQQARLHSRRKVPTGVVPRLLDPAEMVGRSPEMRKVQTLLSRIGPTDASVLITGETGAGKELAARRIHQLSRRSGGPFVPINCGAIPEALLENELFGHVQGAYTDSGKEKPGLLEEADGGTLFLDEVCELSCTLQAKFLRVLETGTFRRLGESKERHVDVRIVAAGNRDLPAEMKAGRFRVDFYYRLAVMIIDLPPLRRRREDIPALVEYFLGRYCSTHKAAERRFSPSAIRMLEEYDWPGNVREVRNVVERLAILVDNPVITPADVIESLQLPRASHEVELPGGGARLPFSGLSGSSEAVREDGSSLRREGH